MDHAVVVRIETVRELSKSDEVKSYAGETCVAKAKSMVEGLRSWPEGSYWKQQSSISEPVLDGNSVTWDWMLPNRASGYMVYWSRNSKESE